MFTEVLVHQTQSVKYATVDDSARLKKS